MLADLMEAGQSFTVVRGGEGGDGNAAFASPYCRRPKEFTAGEEGEERLLEVEMRVIADVGMVSLTLCMYVCIVYVVVVCMCVYVIGGLP